MPILRHHLSEHSVDGSDIRLVSSDLIVHDVPDAEDRARMHRAEQLDFSSDGPPLPVCHFCDNEYRDWSLDATEPCLMPEACQGVSVCEDDFLRLLTETGKDIPTPLFSYTIWERKLAGWRESQDEASHHG